MNRRLLLAVITTGAVLVLAGCASIASQLAASPSSSAACTTKACIASEIQKDLIGIVAKDEAVVTAATCETSTVKHNAGDTWTVTCKVTESDGSVSSGYANLVPSSGTITYDPQTIIKS